MNCNSLSEKVIDHIKEGITRKLIKSLFMPLIYGKSLLSMANDIYNHYGTLLTHKESRTLANLLN